MIGLNNHIPTMVYTQRGLIPIDQAVYGDIVIEYQSNSKLQIMDVKRSIPLQLYQVEYTDGRIEIYTEDDIILDGTTYVTIQDMLCTDAFSQIKQFPVDFRFAKIKPKLNPDPYAAGAFIIHGRYDIPYLNLPKDRSGADSFISHKYHLDFANKLEDNTVFYMWNGSEPDSLITWKEFFPYYDFYITSRRIVSPLIPVEYSQATILDRRKFIRGVFDIGYSKDIFPNTIGVAGVYEYRLKEVQKMLWSLGISSKVSYDPNMEFAKGREFRLDVMVPYDTYPGHFFYIDNLISMISSSTRLDVERNQTMFRIKSIVEINRGTMSNIVLEKPNALYMTENFIPRISL